MKSDGAVTALPLLRDRCLFLLLTMIAMLLFYHYVWVDPTLTSTIFFVMMASGIYAVSSSRRHTVVTAMIGAITVTLFLIGLAHPSLPLALAANTFVVAWFGYMLVIVLLYVVRGRKVTRDKIFGAISVYFLIAFFWAFLYRLLFILNPASFTGNHPLAATGTYHVEFLYYSFGTISTLGFSDIQAASDFARSLSVLEVVTGNFYIAVLISRLVSMYRSEGEE
jgi:hypothetical protein